jgi:hypothetical protein
MGARLRLLPGAPAPARHDRAREGLLHLQGAIVWLPCTIVLNLCSTRKITLDGWQCERVHARVEFSTEKCIFVMFITFSARPALLSSLRREGSLNWGGAVMSLSFDRIPSISAVNLAVACLIAATSVGVAGPAALVESVVTQSASTNVMSYVETGKRFRLGSQDTMVLSYLDSCLRETITGGTVTIGIDHSEVQGGKVTRTKLDCGSNLVELTGSTAQFAGRAVRGLPPPEMAPSRGGGSNGL